MDANLKSKLEAVKALMANDDQLAAFELYLRLLYLDLSNGKNTAQISALQADMVSLGLRRDWL